MNTEFTHLHDGLFCRNMQPRLNDAYFRWIAFDTALLMQKVERPLKSARLLTFANEEDVQMIGISH